MARPLKIAKSSTIDSGFNNPAGASYGAVGGNTSISGSQVLCRVAIGQTGTGTITASTSSTTVTGVGTAFSTQHLLLTQPQMQLRQVLNLLITKQVTSFVKRVRQSI
mgnify:CR=1 FL=1